MKKTVLSIGIGLVGLAMLPSCNNSDDKASADGKKPVPAVSSAPAAPLPAEAMPNYRFVSFDSIMANYNLAIDFQESFLRMQSDLTAKLKNYYDQGAKLEKKYNDIGSGVITSDAEIDAFIKERDQFLNSQSKTEQALSEKQSQIELQQAQNMQILMDSVKSFIRDFSVANGYTAVFSAEGSFYYHPDLDVTEEVITGLNARYNKVGN